MCTRNVRTTVHLYVRDDLQLSMRLTRTMEMAIFLDNTLAAKRIRASSPPEYHGHGFMWSRAISR